MNVNDWNINHSIKGWRACLDNFGDLNSQWWGRRTTMFLPLLKRLEGVKRIKARHILSTLKHGTQDLEVICTSSYHHLECQLQVNQLEEPMGFGDPKIVTARKRASMSSPAAKAVE